MAKIVAKLVRFKEERKKYSFIVQAPGEMKRLNVPFQVK
jgi:hypothetical protein